MNYPKRGLSVDVGNEKIKVAEYSRNKDKIKVKHVVILDTPDNCLNDGQIEDITTLATVIKDGLKDNGVKSKNVIFTVSSSKIITREVELPDLPKKKLDTLIQMNAEEYFPVNLTEYTLDNTIVEKIEVNSEKQVRVNIIAALTSMAESYVELADLIGLKIAGIDYSGNSIVNFARHIQEERTYMLLDLGSDSTMVTIMNQGVARFNRNLVYGTKVISNSIQNHFGVDYKEAMKISTDQSLLTHSPEGNDYLSSDVSAALNQILNGVSRLVDYYVSRNKDGIDRIILVGGGTNIKGIDQYISEYFNIKTKIIDGEDIAISGSEKFESNKVFFANTIGAIYSEVNLLPASIANKGKERASVRLRLELGILIIALLGVACYLPYANLQRLKVERDDLLIEIREKSVVNEVLANHKDAMDRLAFSEGIASISGSTTETVVNVLEVMEKSNPSDIDYLSFLNTEEGVVIACIASDKINVVNYIISLKELKVDGKLVFSDVLVPSMTTVENETSEDEYITFSILCNYNKEVE